MTMIATAPLRRLLRLARATAEALEADKHTEQPGLVEVQLLRQVVAVEACMLPASNKAGEHRLMTPQEAATWSIVLDNGMVRCMACGARWSHADRPKHEIACRLMGLGHRR